MNKQKPNNDNSENYHICLNAEQSERLKAHLKEYLQDANKPWFHLNHSETLNRQWKQTIKDQLSSRSIQEAKDWVTKLIDEDQKNRVYTYYSSRQSDNLKNVVLSLNIAPQNSLKNYFKKINYAQSINEALAKDWNNVYGYLNTGFLSALKEHLANKPNNRESDERKFGQ